MENKPDLVDALSSYREILRRETAFLQRQVRSRNLDTVVGKRAYLLRHTQSNTPRLESEIKEVSLPYLVSSREEALDFLLHESLLLRYRVQSLASIITEFSMISSHKVKMLLIMSRALVWISRHIMRSDVSTSPKEKKDAISSYPKHRLGWESTWGSGTPDCGFFNDITTLSPMHFTHSAPGIFPDYATTGTALQIYSIEIVDLNPNLDWPLYVYGVVAARDRVDRNRNLLFCRSKANRQKLTQDDPFLRLTGPSRAIMAAEDVTEDVTFEAELRINYGAESQDTAVLSCHYRYHFVYDTPELRGGCCTAKLSLEQLATAIQATIVGVHVVEGGWPFKDGGRVSCFSFTAKPIGPTPRQVVLLDCGGGEMPVGSDDYFRLSRNVVLVKQQGTLRVAIQAYSKSGGIAKRGHVDFPVKHCQTSERECLVGNSKVKVIVAWSLLVKEKLDIMLEGYVQA